MTKLEIAKAGVGRPTKYRKEFCQRLILWAHKNRLPFQCFAAEVHVSIDTLYEWCKRHKEFAEARRIAKAYMVEWLIKQGYMGMAGKVKGFNIGAWAMLMKNCADFQDNPGPEQDPIEDMEF